MPETVDATGLQFSALHKTARHGLGQHAKTSFVENVGMQQACRCV